MKGADELVARLGHRPSFHDAEIVEVRFTRDPLMLSMNVVLAEPPGTSALVEFALLELVRFDDFNHQNVVGDLLIEEDDGRLRVRFWGLYGLDTEFWAREASVQLRL